ncbi:MAG: cytochrome c biogenesis protein CcsA [Coriobacteriia bacterium]
MDPLATQTSLAQLVATVDAVGAPLQWILFGLSLGVAVVAVVPQLRALLRTSLMVLAVALVAGEGLLVWFHMRLYDLCAVVSPDSGAVTGHVAVPLWVESEKLYVWALLVAVMGVLARRHAEELLPGVALIAALLAAGAVLWGKPFTEPLPSFLGQYVGYLQAAASGQPQAAYGAYQGMEASRQYYYNTWFMWVHPPLLFIAYGAFAVSFVATLQMLKTRYSAYETTAYRWARLGFIPLTGGMLLGFPWAIMAWQGQSWWWSGKVNMSIMLWFLYTAYLHARLYLRRRGMWKWVAALAILSFFILVLTYLATYIVPGAHSYALVPVFAEEFLT